MSRDPQDSESQSLVAKTTQDVAPDASTANASGELTVESDMKKKAKISFEAALHSTKSLCFEGSDIFSYNLSKVVTERLSRVVQGQFDDVFADSGLSALEDEPMNGEIHWKVHHEVREQICHHEKVLKKTMLNCRTLIAGKFGSTSISIPLRKVSIHTSIPAPRQTFEEATKSQVRYSIEEAKMLEDEEARNALIQQVENGLMQLESKVNERLFGDSQRAGSKSDADAFVSLDCDVDWHDNVLGRAKRLAAIYGSYELFRWNKVPSLPEHSVVMGIKALLVKGEEGEEWKIIDTDTEPDVYANPERSPSDSPSIELVDDDDPPSEAVVPL